MFSVAFCRGFGINCIFNQAQNQIAINEKLQIRYTISIHIIYSIVLLL